jgi:ABC-type bacteriocin/lantibiotic exporter with double-glycine peptidase domain
VCGALIVVMPRVFASGRRVIFACLLVATLLEIVTAATLAWCVHHLFDELAGRHHHPYPTDVLIAASLAAACFLLILQISQRRLTEGMGLSYASEARLALFEHMLRMPPRAVLGKKPGIRLLPFVGDLTSLRQWVSDGLARGLAAILTIVALLGWLGLSSAVLASALGGVIALFAIGSYASSGLFEHAVREVRKRRGALSSFVSGRLAAVGTIVGMSRERTEYRKLADRIDSMNRAAFKRAWIEGTLRGMAHAATALLVITTLIVGRHEVTDGRLTAGWVVGTLSLVNLLGVALRDLVHAMELWIPGRVAQQRIQGILDEPVRKGKDGDPETADLPDDHLQIVDFALPGLLEKTSLTASAGDRILLEGPGGSGKSSFMAALAGLIDPVAGHVSYQGIALSNLPSRISRCTLGFASLMLPLLPGSIGMNLRYRMPDADAEEIIALLEAMGASEIVTLRPKGLEHTLSDPNGELSLGQIQTILIARALLRTPPILLLDSIDSHLSRATMACLVNVLRSYPGIIIFAATRPELRSIANRMWRMEAEQIFEKQATLDTLLPKEIVDAPK